MRCHDAAGLLDEFVADVVDRTHTAQDQAQCLLAAELSIKAQLAARRVTIAG